MLPHAKAGRLRILVAETIPTYEVSITIGFLAPARMPREVVSALGSEFNRALSAPDVKQRLNSLGVDPVGTTPERFAEAIHAELAQYGELVKRANFRID